jgi:hypothetical protein
MTDSSDLGHAELMADPPNVYQSELTPDPSNLDQSKLTPDPSTLNQSELMPNPSDLDRSKLMTDPSKAKGPVADLEQNDAGIVLEIPVAPVLERSGSETIESVPSSYYECLHSEGFNGIALTEIPAVANLAPVRAVCAAAGLKLMIGMRWNSSEIELVRSGEVDALWKYFEGLANVAPPGTHFAPSAAILLLPGCKLLREAECNGWERLLMIVKDDTVRNGRFVSPQTTSILGISLHGNM